MHHFKGGTFVMIAAFQVEYKMECRSAQEGVNVADRIRLPFDRRSGKDRRKTQKLAHFLNGGSERRKTKEQRSAEERRGEWERVGKWSSVWSEFYDPDEFPSE
jgi:hypothetical protein